MSFPLIPGTDWGIEPKTYDFYVKNEEEYIPLYISHNELKNINHLYSLIAKDAYCDVWRTVTVDNTYSDIQKILNVNKIDFENNFIVVVLDCDENIVSKARLSKPDKIEILPSNEGGGA